MEGCTVLIADSSEDFCRELHNILRWDCTVATCTRGRKALRMVQELRPQVLVLDLMLPELDGISLLKALSASDCRPAVIATTNLISNYIISAAESVQVDYLICKPCDIHATAARVQEQLARLRRRKAEPQDLTGRISELLLLLGISIKLHGFRYLREAVALMIEDPEQSITKELYPAVARICGCSPSQVERSIRGAIGDGWDHRDQRIWRLYFLPDGQGRELRPTNAVFVTRIADGIKTACSRDPSDRPEFIPRQPEA